MKIISWNIQKITSDKATAFSRTIGGMISDIAGDEPFVLLVLENKTNPEEVLDAIGTGLRGDRRYIPMGGGAGVQENLLVITGNGATLSGAEPFTNWQPVFDASAAAMHAQEIATAAARPAPPARGAYPRAAITAGRAAQTAQVVDNTPVDAALLRNPIAVEIAHPGGVVKLLALHSPGPSAGSDHLETYAELYAHAVLSTADWADMVVGDFNLRTDLARVGPFFDRSVQTGATTKGKEGRHTYSRLDRLYTKPGQAIGLQLHTDSSAEKDLTDHHCLVVDHAAQGQPTIPDYFSFVASPHRQMELRQARRAKARSAKSGVDRNVKKLPSAASHRAKRAKDAEDRRHQRRQADAMQRREAFAATRQAKVDAFFQAVGAPGATGFGAAGPSE